MWVACVYSLVGLFELSFHWISSGFLKIIFVLLCCFNLSSILIYQCLCSFAFLIYLSNFLTSSCCSNTIILFLIFPNCETSLLKCSHSYSYLLSFSCFSSPSYSFCSLYHTDPSDLPYYFPSHRYTNINSSDSHIASSVTKYRMHSCQIAQNFKNIFFNL